MESLMSPVVSSLQLRNRLGRGKACEKYPSFHPLVNISFKIRDWGSMWWDVQVHNNCSCPHLSKETLTIPFQNYQNSVDSTGGLHFNIPTYFKSQENHTGNLNMLISACLTLFARLHLVKYSWYTAGDSSEERGL